MWLIWLRGLHFKADTCFAVGAIPGRKGSAKLLIR